MTQESLESMEIKYEISHVLRESAVVLLTQGPEKMQEWFGTKPLVRTVIRFIKAKVRTGWLEGPDTRYYISAKVSEGFSTVTCFIVDTTRISEYCIFYGESPVGAYTSAPCCCTVKEIVPRLDSLMVEDSAGGGVSVPFSRIDRVEGPGSLLDNPMFEVVF